MPKALGKADLKNLEPTEEEVNAAKTILNNASEKQLKSRMGCFSAWCKQHCDDGEVSNSRGEQRKKWLEAFLIHQARAKHTTQKVTHDRVIREGQGIFEDLFWWAEEEMDTNMGARKAKSWRDSGKMIVRPCPLTGSMEEHLKVYGVPRHWERVSHEDFQAMKAAVEADASEQDIKNLKDAALDSGGPGDNTQG